MLPSVRLSSGTGAGVTARPIKLLILMTDLDDLGVQRVVINLYHHFSMDIEPTLVLWKKEGKVSSFLRPRGRIYETDHGLKKPRILRRLPRYLEIIKKVKPDVILSCVPVTNVSISLLRSFLPRNIAIIGCEHAFLTRAFATGEYQEPFRILYRTMLRPMYNRIMDRLVMTAEAGKQDAIEGWGLNGRRIEVIYNPQDIAELNSRACEPLDDVWFFSDEPVIVAAGRLTAQKGFDKLLRAFAVLRGRCRVRLAILGRGGLEAELMELSKILGISDSVRFLGFQSNHLKYIRAAKVFVLSSVWEAMPMVLAETMVIGTPIVSFDCPSGPREMLDNGRCGYLVADQDVEQLAIAMESAVVDSGEASRRAGFARERVAFFGAENIARMYERLFSQVIAERVGA